MTPSPARSPRPPGARRRSNQSLPAWFSSDRAKGRIERGPRRIRSVGRHARPAILAVLLASGIGFVRPTEVSLVSTQPTPLAQTAAAASPRPATAAGPPQLPAPNPPATVAQADVKPPPQLSAFAPEPPVASRPPSVTGAAVGAVLPSELPSSLARRRAQTWQPPARPADLTGYVWPLRGTVTVPFGPSAWGELLVNNQAFHDGIDIATWCGDRIVAAHDGLVLAAGRRFDEKVGWVGGLAPYFARLDVGKLWWSLPIAVVIDDGNGYRSIYAHFWQVLVRAGQHVHAGQLIGYEGATGLATGCHLHYGLFSPHETATFALQPAVAKRMSLPSAEIARIDPLLVLPARRSVSRPTAAFETVAR